MAARMTEVNCLELNRRLSGLDFIYVDSGKARFYLDEMIFSETVVIKVYH